MTREADDDYVSVPLGLVALYWIRMFKPLVQADLPQSPTNRGMEGLGFVRYGFRTLSSVSHLGLRVGGRFQGGNASVLRQALRDACDTVTKNVGYSSHLKPTIAERFVGEARASLPSLMGVQQPSLGDVFGGIALQRLRLKQDRQVTEWI